MGRTIYLMIQKCEKRYKIAFVSSFIVGILTHLYMIVNKFPNHDYSYNIYGDQFGWPLSLGRWFLNVPASLSTDITMPWINGILTIIYLAVASIFLISILEIRNEVVIILSTSLFVTYPAVTDTMGFMFTVDAYMMGLIFAVMSVWVWHRVNGKKAYLLAAVLMALSLGIYQAHLSFMLVLILVRLILDIIEKNYTNIGLRNRICKIILIGLMGTGFYYAMSKIITQYAHTPLDSYMGINEIKILSIRQIFLFLQESIFKFIEHFIGGNSNFTNYEKLNIIFIISFFVIYIYVIIKKKILENKIQFVIFIIASALIIPAVYICELISPKVFYRFLMLHSVILIYILLVILVDRYVIEKISNLFMIFFIAVIFNFIIIDNLGYFNLNICWQQTYATAIQMQERIQSLEGYNHENKVLIWGTMDLKHNSREWILKEIPELMIGINDTNLMRNEIFILPIMRYDLGMNLTSLDSEEREVLASSEEVSNMGHWPENNSVKMIEDIIVIKLSN